jgi:ABC-type polysaccharide/polyol phosphate transport system ATPase subunit
MSSIIECNNIFKAYKIKNSSNSNNSFFNALSNVSFTLNEGDRLGLVGLNGSGKSTLLKIIGGFIKPSSGSILIKKSVSSLSGFDSLLHPDLNAIENCKLQLQILGFKKNEIPSLIEEILTFSELEDFAFQPVKTFSSGMMLRLSFAIFSVTSPEILLLDEVLSAGDIKFQRKIEGLMQNTFKNTAGIIIASHQLSEIQEYCNKCLVLKNGTIEFYGKVDNAMKKYSDLNNKPEIIYHNNFVEIENISINSTSIKTSDSIKIKFTIKNLIDNLDINPALFINSFSGKVLIDSPVYNSSFDRSNKSKGIYNYEVEIPGNLINIGSYNISLYIGSTNNILYVSLINQFAITINIDEWESKCDWKIATDYPIRTRINWRIK